MAVGQAVETRNDFRRFHDGLQKENPDELAAMGAELAAWEADHDQPDPYLLPKSSKTLILLAHLVLTFRPDISLETVRLVMAQEEKARAEAGTSLMYDVSAGSFLLLGLDIQKMQ